MEESKHTSRIESLKKKLYSRTRKNTISKEKVLEQKSFDVKDDWHRPADVVGNTSSEELKFQTEEKIMTKKHSSLNKALIGAFIFFILTAIYAVLSFTGSGGVISSKNIDIVISGPVSIAAGDVLSLQVDVRNKNDVALELTDLLIEYPEGTRTADNITRELKRERFSLGDIASGKNSEKVIESILFGEEGEKKIIKIEVEYRVEGSNAIFVTEREYQVEIVSSPVSMEVSSPTSISSGQEIEFVVKVVANSANTVSNVLLSAEYPFGFEFTSANINPSYDDNVWELGNLKEGSTKTVRIKGVLLGQNSEERTFRFQTGIPSEFDEKIIGTPFLTNSSSIVIQRPFISIDLALNGNTSEIYTADTAGLIRGDISWQNNLPSKISNVSVEVSIQGSILDEATVSSGKGFFRSTDKKIIWDSRTFPSLSSLEAGESGTASFSFKSLGESALAGTNISPDIKLVANIYGDSFDDSGVPKRIVTTLEKTVQIKSVIDVGARSVHFVGPFINSGPMPPKVNSETTYTVILSASNLLNDITGADVTAILPTYVRWMGVVSPSSENIVYNPVGGKVTWKVGNLKKGVGYSSPAKEVAFKVALTPSVSQVGTSVDIVKDIKFEAQDVYTDTLITDTFGRITTRLSTDPQFIDSQSQVVE